MRMQTRACVRMLGFQKQWNASFLHLNLVWNEFHIVWELSLTPIFRLYKAIKGTFSSWTDFGGKHISSLENSESKREFFTKHTQVEFYSIETFFWSWSLSSKCFLTYFELVVTRLTKENGQNQALKSSRVEVKFLTLTLHFSLIFFVSLCLYMCFKCYNMIV